MQLCLRGSPDILHCSLLCRWLLLSQWLRRPVVRVDCLRFFAGLGAPMPPLALSCVQALAPPPPAPAQATAARGVLHMFSDAGGSEAAAAGAERPRHQGASMHRWHRRQRKQLKLQRRLSASAAPALSCVFSVHDQLFVFQ